MKHRFHLKAFFPVLLFRQKKAKRKEEEKDLQKREAENADGKWAENPRSVEDFERLLLTQGDTSIVWIRSLSSFVKCAKFHLKLFCLSVLLSSAKAIWHFI